MSTQFNTTAITTRFDPNSMTAKKIQELMRLEYDNAAAVKSEIRVCVDDDKLYAVLSKTPNQQDGDSVQTAIY